MRRWPEHHRPCAPHRASLSTVRLSSEAKVDFFTPHSHHRSSRLYSVECLTLLAVAATDAADCHARVPEQPRRGLHFTWFPRRSPARTSAPLTSGPCLHRTICFSPSGPARARRLPLFAVGAASSHPRCHPHAHWSVSNRVVLVLCSQRRAEDHLGTPAAFDVLHRRAPHHRRAASGTESPAATSSSTPPASCCSPISPPMPVASPPVCRR
jgi:hypothetical protein